MQILIIEDEAKIAAMLKRGLTEEHYTVDIARTGEAGLEKTTVNSYDLIVIDLMIPAPDGLTVCRRIRRDNTAVPILILTAKDDVADKIAGLDVGADDYMTKPFHFAEVSARIRALLRRGNKADPTILTAGDVTLDPAAKTVKRKGVEITLTAREYALLEYLLRNQNRILSRSQILDHVWDFEYDGLSNIVETYIKYLRRKLRLTPQSPELIHTVRGFGYIIKP